MALKQSAWWQSCLTTIDRVRWSLGKYGGPGLSRRDAPNVDSLEPRVLFSATPIDPAMMTAEDPTMTAQVETDEPGQLEDSNSASQASSLQTARVEIVIVDPRVPDLQQILDDLSRSSDQRDVYVLDAERDGIQQISEILDLHSDVDALHIVSHGSDGKVKLGNVWLEEPKLDGYAGDIASWGNSFAADADILFYGCDLAATQSGQALVDSVAALSGADVAASTDDTGHVNLNADWILEYETGAIESAAVFSTDLQDSWQQRLAIIQVTILEDTLDGGDGETSLREAIIQANILGGDNTIELGVGTYEVSRPFQLFQPDEEVGDLNVSSNITITGLGTADTSISGMGYNRVFEINSGTLTISDLTIVDGGALLTGAAIRIDSGAEVVANNVVFSSNESGGRGGAISNSGTLSLTDVTLLGNKSYSDGGAIRNNGVATLNRVTLSNNESQADGGGIFNDESATSLDLTNVTISGNTATGLGGGIHSLADFHIQHSTIALNDAASGGGISTDGGTGQLFATIISDNTASDHPDVLGVNFQSNGYNLVFETDGTAGFIGTDILGQSADLNALADNGGIVQTHSLHSTSAAIDAAITSTETLDARSGARQLDGDGDTIGESDIGATELVVDNAHIIVVTNTTDVVNGNTSSIADLKLDQGGDGVSLREAIEAVNNTTNGSFLDEIHFDIAGAGVHTIEVGSRLDVTDSVIINAATQIGYAIGAPVIVLDNTGTQETFKLSTDGITVRGFSLINATTALSLHHSNGHTIVGNHIGLDASGNVAGNEIGIEIDQSENNLIGGTIVDDQNVISGNTVAGIDINHGSTNNQIIGNYIGVNVAGDAVVAQTGNGIHIRDGSHGNTIGGVGAGNIIGGFDRGILLDADAGVDNEILGNFLGTDAAGTADFGNNYAIELLRGNVKIGGVDPGEGNLIAFSAFDGVSFPGDDSTSNRYGAEIRGNSFYNNAQLGIDLGVDGLTANDYGAFDDTDDGPNHLNNFPDLLSATTSNGTLTVAGEVYGDLIPNGILDFYVTDSDNHQGKTYLGSHSFIPDSGGFASFSVDFDSAPVSVGQYITVLNTHSDGSTSEFSGGMAVTINNVAPTDILLSNSELNENINTAGGQLVGTLSVEDADASDTASFTIIGGADETAFSIGGANGDELYLDDGILDFETQDSYSVQIEVSDSGGNLFDKTLTISVIDQSAGVIVVDTASDQNDTGRTDFDIQWLLNNKGTDGKISFREALVAANNTANEGVADRIEFNIPGDPQHIISINSALPEIVDTVVIDGATDPTYVDHPIIVLRGKNTASDGLVLASGSGGSTIRGLVVRDFGLNGIAIHTGSDGNTIAGNWIGGMKPVNFNTPDGQKNAGAGIYVASSNNTIGGNSAADKNIITNNTSHGILIDGGSANDNSVLGNWIGISPDGTSAKGNEADGIAIFSGASGNVIGTAAAGNVIGGNDKGIHLSNGVINTTIAGNFIGTDATGTSDFGNTQAGIYLSNGTTSTTIGGSLANANTITNNGADGVTLVSGSSNNSIRFNEFRDNTGLGIDLNDDGVVNNDNLDGDGDANQTQNHPSADTVELTQAGDLVISGSLNSTANSSFEIDVYESAGDTSGHGEATRHIGTFSVTTDSGGLATFVESLSSTGIATGESITMTATDALGNTSEFGANVIATDQNIAPVLSSIESGAIAYTENQGAIQLTATLSITDANDSTLESAVVSINGFVAGEDFLDATVPGTITKTWNPVTGTLTLDGTDTIASYESVLRSVSYSNSSDQPDLSTRTFEFAVFDNDVSSNVASRNLGITPENDSPSGNPSIDGTTTEGQILSANTSGISDPDGLGAFTFQWFRGATVVSTTSTHTLTNADVGEQLQVAVSYTDDQGFNETVFSALSSAVTGVNDPAGGTPIIVGNATENQVLSVDTAPITDDDGLGTFNYQWVRGATVVSTAASYTLGDDDVDQQLKVVVSFTDGQGFNESVESALTATVTGVNDPAGGTPIILGSATENQVLSVDTAPITDDDGLGTFNYQWVRGATVVSTAASYTLGDDDVGQQLKVVVSFTDGQGFNESVESALTATVTGVNDPAGGTPIILGSATENQVLSVDTAPITDDDGLGTFNYQWVRGATVVSTAASYTLGDDDVGQQLKVVVSFTDGQGFNESVESALTATVTGVNDPAGGTPIIVGSATEDQILSVNTAPITDDDGLGTFTYQWFRGTTLVSTASTYTLDDPDVGSPIRVVVSYVDGQGFSESVASAQTTPVTGVNDAPTGEVTIDGTAVVGQTLTANYGSISDPDGVSPPTFLWYRDGTALTSETNQIMLLSAADQGANIRVEITYLDGQGTNETIISNPTATVAAQDQSVFLNHPPNNQVTLEDQPFSFTLPVGTFIDPDGEPITYMARLANGNSLPAWLNFDASTQTFSGTPSNGNVGTIMVRVFASDGPPHLATADFDLTVVNVNDAPTMENRTRGSAYADKVVVGTQFFNNASSDVDSTGLTALLVTPPDVGTLDLQADGSFVYTAEPDFFGKVTFQWKAFDGEFDSNVATVTIVIAPPINTSSTDEPDSETKPETENTDEGDSSDEGETTDEPEVEVSPITGAPTDTDPTETGTVLISTPLVHVIDNLGLDDDRVMVLDFETDASVLRRELNAAIDSDQSRARSGASSFSSTGLRSASVSPFNTPNNPFQFIALRETGEIWNQLDQQQQDVDALLSSEQLAMGSVGVATSGLTVGFVAWALRGGFFLSGLLTQLPLWKSIDPLLIMQGVGQGDTDTLEDIMEKERQALDDRGKVDGAR